MTADLWFAAFVAVNILLALLTLAGCGTVREQACTHQHATACK